MKLKFELVNGYGILVDEEANIRKGDIFYLEDANVIAKYETVEPIKESVKIIFAEIELGLDLPVFEWREFEILEKIQHILDKKAKEDNKIDLNAYGNGLIDCYKSNPAKFTEEDLRKAIELTLIDAEKSVIWSATYHYHLSKKIIQSLQKYPKYVVMDGNNVKEIIWR